MSLGSVSDKLWVRLLVSFCVFGLIGAGTIEAIRFAGHTQKIESDQNTKGNETQTNVSTENKSEEKQTKEQTVEKKPKTLQELIKEDFKNFFILNQTAVINTVEHPSGKIVPIQIEVHIMVDFNAKAKFLAAYIPQTPATFTICQGLADGYKDMFDVEKNVGIEGGMFNEKTNLKEMQFTRRVYIYHETPLMKEQKDSVEKLFKRKRVSVILRDSTYAFDRNFRTYTFPNVAEEKKENSK